MYYKVQYGWSYQMELFACILQKKKKDFWDSIYFVPTALSNMSPITSDFLLIVFFCVFFKVLK